MKKVRGGLSAVYAAILAVCCPISGSLWNFDLSGNRLPLPRAEGSSTVMWFCVIDMGLLGDEKALSEASNGKGASARKPCLPTPSGVAGQMM